MRWLLAAALCGGLLIGAPVRAEPYCEGHDRVATLLRENYQELPMGVGLTPGGRLIELFVSERGTFTVFVTAPTGLSCVIAVGTDWQRQAADRSDQQPVSRMTR